MQTQQFERPKTLKEAGAIINALNMPLPATDKLMALARIDTIQFKDDLYNAVNQIGEWQNARTRAYCALSACADWFEASLTALKYDIPLEERVKKAVAYGPQFVEAVQRAPLATDEGDKARNLLSTMLGARKSRPATSSPTPEKPSTVEPSTAEPQASAVPPMPEPATEPEPQPETPMMASPTPETTSSVREIASSGEGEKKYLSVHVYGGSAAACFSADTKKNSTTQTLRIETAVASGTRVYDWQNKIAVQLSVKELPLVLGVLMGWLPAYKADGHGEKNDKGFSIERQEGKFFLSMFQKGKKIRALPVPPGDAYCITSLVIRQMVANDPHLTSAEVLKLTYAALSVVPNANATRH